MVTKADIAWAAGFLEGEGSFSARRGPKVTACQVDLEPLERLRSLFGGVMFKRKTPKGTPAWVWAANGTRGAGVIFTVFPFLSQRRRSQAAAALTAWRSRPPPFKYRTHCRNGHQYTEASTMIVDRPGGKTWRRCRPCYRARYNGTQ